MTWARAQQMVDTAREGQDGPVLNTFERQEPQDCRRLGQCPQKLQPACSHCARRLEPNRGLADLSAFGREMLRVAHWPSHFVPFCDPGSMCGRFECSRAVCHVSCCHSGKPSVVECCLWGQASKGRTARCFWGPPPPFLVGVEGKPKGNRSNGHIFGNHPMIEKVSYHSPTHLRGSLPTKGDLSFLGKCGFS